MCRENIAFAIGACLLLCLTATSKAFPVTEGDQVYVNEAPAVEDLMPEENPAEPLAGLLFEGDIAGVLTADDTTESLKAKLDPLSKAGVIASNLRWYGAAIPYEISSAYSQSERALIVKGLGEFSKTQSINFYARNGQTDYVFIHRGAQGTGCYSYVGKQGGKQIVNLEANCLRHGTIVHELMHATGFWHEQSRPDRDTYVEINWNNVQAGQEHNFLKYGTHEVTTFAKPYDYGSIMHYEKTAFAQYQGVWTIRPKAPYQNYEIRAPNGFSPTDIQKLDSMYPTCATLYKDADLKGASAKYASGVEYNLHSQDYNTFSSAKVEIGCKLTICKAINFQGGCTVMGPFTGPVGNFYNFATMSTSGSWDNVAKSAKCSC